MKSKLLTALLAASLFFIGSAYAANTYAANNRAAYQDGGSYQAQIRQLVALSGVAGVPPRILATAYVHNTHAAYQFRQLAATGGPEAQPEFLIPFIFHFGRWVWIYARKEWPRILSFLVFAYKAYNYGSDLIEAAKDYFSAEDIDGICGTYQNYLDSDDGEPDGYDDNEGYDEEEYEVDDEDEKNLNLLCYENPM